MENNYVSQAAKKETNFVNDLIEATKQFFQTGNNLEILLEKKNRTIKAFRDDENKVIYVFDKNKTEFKIYHDSIYDFNQEKNTREILHFDMILNMKKGEDLGELYRPMVFSFGEEKKPYDVSIDLKEKLRQSSPDKAEEMIGHFTFLFGEDFDKNPDFLEYAGLIRKLSFSSEVSVLSQYTNLLISCGYMKENYSVDFFEKLNTETCIDMNQKLPGILVEMDLLIQVCKDNKYTSYKNSFEFNDTDNHVFLHKGKLCVTDQNCGFYFDIKDNDNFIVYFLEKEYKSVTKEIKRIDNAIKTDTLNVLKDIAFEVVDGTVVRSNNGLMSSFELDIQCSALAMERQGLGKRKFSIDIESYEYQKNYYQAQYKYNEFEFLAQAFLTIGGGFTYDEEKGLFFTPNIKYIENLPIAPDSRHEKNDTFNYCYPKTISNLNTDWLDGLKYMVKVLKEDKPTPSAFEGNSADKAVEKAIIYFDSIIMKLENKNKPKMK